MPEWTPLMDTGIPRIDEDHRELVRRLNEFGQAMKRGRGRDSVSALLKFLSDYVDFHFSYEEELMTTCGFPEYEEHKVMHEWFRKELARRIEAFAASPDERNVTIDIHGWVMSWLMDHSLNTDAKLGDFIRSRQET
jgi:hemerythrin